MFGILSSCFGMVKGPLFERWIEMFLREISSVLEKIALKRFGSISEKIQRNICCTTATSFFRQIDINLGKSANFFVI